MIKKEEKEVKRKNHVTSLLKPKVKQSVFIVIFFMENRYKKVAVCTNLFQNLLLIIIEARFIFC